MHRITYITLLAAGTSLSATALAQTPILTAEGSFGAGSANEHSFEVEAGQTIEVVARGGEGIDTTLTANLPNGESVQNDDYDGFHAGFMRSFATGGTVNIEVNPLSRGDSGGGYTLTVVALPPADALAIGSSIDGQLTGGARDRYQVNGNAGDRVVIDLRSFDFDSYLTVTDGAGNELTDDDGGDEGYNSRLQYRFEEDGAITITASSLGSSSGRYNLSVERLDIEQDMQHQGALAAGDARAYDGKLYDTYEIEGEAGETISITLESDDFDTVLFLSNPDGTNLGRNDDGPDGSNSELTVRLFETGTHTIYVTGLFDDTGEYTLTVYR